MGRIRPGHHRPLGTTTTMRFESSRARLPRLGDIACQTSGMEVGDCDYVRRAYRVVGILEGASRDRFRLVLERVEYGTLPESLDPDAIWPFYSLPRR